MEQAFFRRDETSVGSFYAAVTTTGIFCTPACPAKRPSPANVEYYRTARDAVAAGFRPCRRCRPLEYGDHPAWLSRLLEAVEEAPDRRFRDADLAGFGADPATIRRWFTKRYGMSFHAYSRARRLARAFTAIRDGMPVGEAGMERGWESFSGFREAFAGFFRSPPASASARDRADAPPWITVGWIESPLGPLVAGTVRMRGSGVHACIPGRNPAGDAAGFPGPGRPDDDAPARDKVDGTVEALCLLEFSDRRKLAGQFGDVTRRFRDPGKAGAPGDPLPLVPGDSDLIDRLRLQLDEYFSGERREFSLPLALEGSPFRERVWRALLSIPYGRTMSYSELAGMIGAPGAARAAGTANGYNRIAIVVPCHRIVLADGSPGAYAGGIWRKHALLELERGDRRFS